MVTIIVSFLDAPFNKYNFNQNINSYLNLPLSLNSTSTIPYRLQIGQGRTGFSNFLSGPRQALGLKIAVRTRVQLKRVLVLGQYRVLPRSPTLAIFRKKLLKIAIFSRFFLNIVVKYTKYRNFSEKSKFRKPYRTVRVQSNL